jgi:hypothetical protein
MTHLLYELFDFGGTYLPFPSTLFYLILPGSVNLHPNLSIITATRRRFQAPSSLFS